MARDVAVLIGSLRKDSLNRKLAHAMMEIAPSSLKLEEVPIIDLPLYNPDQDNAPLAPWTALRQARERYEGLVARIRKEFGRKSMKTVATGGLAPLFDGATPAIERVDPHLTLYGLRLIAERNPPAGKRKGNSRKA